MIYVLFKRLSTFSDYILSIILNRIYEPVCKLGNTENGRMKLPVVVTLTPKGRSSSAASLSPSPRVILINA